MNAKILIISSIIVVLLIGVGYYYTIPETVGIITSYPHPETGENVAALCVPTQPDQPDEYYYLMNNGQYTPLSDYVVDGNPTTKIKGYVTGNTISVLFFDVYPATEFECYGPYWDINDDGITNAFDLSIFANHYFEVCPTREDRGPCEYRWDINGDGIVNALDLSLLTTHYGECWIC